MVAGVGPARSRPATQSDARRTIAVADRTPNKPDLPFQRAATIPRREIGIYQVRYDPDPDRNRRPEGVGIESQPIVDGGWSSLTRIHTPRSRLESLASLVAGGECLLVAAITAVGFDPFITDDLPEHHRGVGPSGQIEGGSNVGSVLIEA